MTNPTPRPALRKAEDATVHPAAPRPARSPRATKAAPAPAPAPDPAPAAEPAVAPVVEVEPRRKKRKFGGATSDHLRVDADAADSPKGKGGKGSGGTPKKPSKAKAEASTRDDLMQGKQTELDVEVPKALRKAAAKRAKAEGLDLRTVVIDALHAYVTRPPR